VGRSPDPRAVPENLVQSPENLVQSPEKVTSAVPRGERESESASASES